MDTTPKRAGALDAAAAHTPTRSAVASWILYDLANTIFSMGVISLFFSLWVRDEVGAERADTVYGIITCDLDGHHLCVLAAAWRDDR
jgi:UMF1 family MFS transporter